MRLSPEAEDLVDGLVGALALAQRARGIVEAASLDGEPGELPAPDEELVLVMVGLVEMARRLESALAGWEAPLALEAAPAASAASLRDLLR